ncbi:uncharacterized protein N7496_005242 [Penicillium cataractarum]|uniref:LysM domain-containing protein n=1 Tax=Penicillium cataractarum TaxID=2100454 RepID=A0A9W9SK67_9EURO|nr:uncharacterized protein N7496_005242 [Penicillium cataractarum]KAJ5377833.1 hypothetical protein N7496_005242 [Penicillium cataractarum]
MRFFWLSSLLITAAIAAPLTPEQMGCPKDGGLCTNPNGYTEDQLAEIATTGQIIRIAKETGTSIRDLCAQLYKDKELEKLKADLPALVSLCK